MPNFVSYLLNSFIVVYCINNFDALDYLWRVPLIPLSLMPLHPLGRIHHHVQTNRTEHFSNTTD